MNKSQLIDAVAEKAEMSKTAATRAVEAIFDGASGAIAEVIRAGGNIAIPGFGRFKTKARPARKGRNPQTGAEIDIPERTVVQFSAGKNLQEGLAGGGGGPRKGARSGSGAASKSRAAAKSGGASKSRGAAKSGGAAKKASAASKSGGSARSGGSAGAAGAAKSGGGAKSGGAAKKAGGAAKKGASKSGGTKK